jgi:hypothetical protein
MTTTLLQKAIYVLFFATILFTVLSLIWFGIDKPFKENVDCKKQNFTSISVNTPPNASWVYQRRVCESVPPHDLTPIHAFFIDAATASGILFVGAAGIAWITRKRDPLDPPTL